MDARIIMLRNGSAGDAADSPPLMLVNPRIVARSDEEQMVLWREICLVLPPELEVEQYFVARSFLHPSTCSPVLSHLIALVSIHRTRLNYRLH